MGFANASARANAGSQVLNKASKSIQAPSRAAHHDNVHEVPARSGTRPANKKSAIQQERETQVSAPTKNGRILRKRRHSPKHADEDSTQDAAEGALSQSPPTMHAGQCVQAYVLLKYIASGLFAFRKSNLNVSGSFRSQLTILQVSADALLCAASVPSGYAIFTSVLSGYDIVVSAL